MSTNIQLQSYQKQNSPQPSLQYNSQYLSVKQQQKAKKQYSKTPHQTQYRADIDGLRAVAVSIVIYFHMYPQRLTGGFIGVDIFFVISGYLISSIIIKQTKNNKFSYLDFYSRRIRRIYPALIVILITVILFACFQLNALQLKIVMKTMTASTFFSANFQILTYQKGYFDPDVKRNSLLHLWSLGVEQQFYILWPFVIYLIMKKFKNNAIQILSIFTISSFILNVVVVNNNPKNAYYFPLCRFWQMSIGGLLAYQKINIRNKKIRQILSIVGITAILVSFLWIINQKSLFPGYWALIPTISSALIIIADKQAFLNKYILSSRIFVFIGKISYPLYLWHWPLLVFCRIMFPINSPFYKPQISIFLTIIFSILTYYFIQNPLRFNKSLNVVRILFICMFLIGIISMVLYSNPQQFSFMQKTQKIFEKDMIPEQNDYYIKNGKKLANMSKNKKRMLPTKEKLQNVWSIRHQAVFQQVKQNSKYFDAELKTKVHFLQILNEGKDKQLFLIGDSHQQHLRPRFLKLYEQSVQQNKTSTFPTILSLSQCGMAFDRCTQHYIPILQYIKHHKPDRVFLKSRWLYWYYSEHKDGPFHNFTNCGDQFSFPKDQSYADVNNSLTNLAGKLQQLIDLGIDVYVGSISPQGQHFNPITMFDFFGIIEENIKPIRLSQFREKYKQTIQFVQNIIKNVKGIKFVDFADHQCWEDICQPIGPKGDPFYRDKDHFRTITSRYWASSVDFLVDFQSNQQKL